MIELNSDTDKASSLSPEAVNRLWQHGLHEERLFHDRLNYFSIVEMGLLSICCMLYNKEPSLALFLPLTLISLIFTLLWLVIQARHWSYCKHVTERNKRLVPEFRATIEEFSEGSWSRSHSVSRILSLAVPILFSCTWLVFFIWLLVRPATVIPPEAFISLERVILFVLILVICWLTMRLRRIERLLQK
jgi:hypothetical protein